MKEYVREVAFTLEEVGEILSRAESMGYVCTNQDFHNVATGDTICNDFVLLDFRKKREA